MLVSHARLEDSLYQKGGAQWFSNIVVATIQFALDLMMNGKLLLEPKMVFTIGHLCHLDCLMQQAHLQGL